eukprot:TRINITY_DN6410_c0_g3_i1.p1 TRINITY_DN6410_c0_g3~~TRINITY_DN6410_c0_g3_i1.p1  ORF type:complete len:553 (-),score=122.90 TRINITY_DN6410_c0_g3_i1:256-1851(-)
MGGQDHTLVDGGNPAKKSRVSAGWDNVPAILEDKSVVKLFCRELKPNYAMPWTTKRQQSSSATAFILSLERRLLLTNRHCVAHASCVEVRKRGDDKKYEAEVLARGTDCDLALLTVREAAFWASAVSEQRLCSEVPSLFAEVVCVGYPTGGDNLCVTKGVVSRVDYEDNADPWRNRLVIQIDAAVNPGNSGGPALIADGRCVGVAYQSLKDGSTENIGFIIPVRVVEKFLAAWRRLGGEELRPAADGQPVRVVAFGHGRFSAQRLENAGMRSALGMREEQSGVLVKSVDPTTPNAEALRPGDVLLALDGVAIGNDGCVPFGCGPTRDDRVPFPFLAQGKFVGDALDAKILRAGEVLERRLSLCEDLPVVPFEKEAPTLLDYAIFGGLVFVVLSKQYLRAVFGDKWRKDRCNGLGEVMHWKTREFDDEQVVVMSYVLAHTVNLGFQDVRNARVSSVGGVSSEGGSSPPERVRNLRHLVESIDAAKEPFLRFELCPRGAGLAPDVIVIDRAAACKAEPELLRRNRIPAARRLS